LQEDEEQVEVTSAFHTGERLSDGPAAVLHERGIPLALRVRSGNFEENGLNLQGAQVLWGDIEFIALGTIRHNLGSLDAPKGMMRQVVGKMMGKSERAEAKAARFQESVFLDIYSSAHDAPFRFEAANINYKSFLGKDAQYISQHNFYRLVVRIARGAQAAALNDNALAFILRRREQVRTYSAVYDFELEVQNDLARLEHLTKTTQIDLSRDSYVTEDEAGEPA
jgi:hypothetical protein